MVASCLAAPFAGAQEHRRPHPRHGDGPQRWGGAFGNVMLKNEPQVARMRLQPSLAETGNTCSWRFPSASTPVELQLTGFKKYVRKSVTLELNQILTLDIPLQLGVQRMSWK